MSNQDLKLKITANASEAKKALRDTGDELEKLNKKIKNSSAQVEISQSRFERLRESAGAKLKTAVKVGSLALVASGGLAIKAAVDYESAFAGVRKTIDATEKEYAELSTSIRQMSREIPSSASEIAKVTEVAGQLGIQKDALMGFTRTIIDLGNATNLVGEEGAMEMARFANIVGMSQKNFDRLGSTIVDLGNKTATTERDIMNMAMRLAGAGKQIGMSEHQILSMAAVLSSVGIEAEMGGSAFSRLMVKMQLAVETGEGLSDFAKVAGKSARDFRKAFKDDAAGAVSAFINGLNKAKSGGKSAIRVLDDMGIKEVRLRDAILRASNAQGIMNKTLDIGKSAWEKNTALAEEAGKRYKTVESRWNIFKNQITDLGVTIGEKTLPVLNKLFDAFQSESFKRAIDSFAKIAEQIGEYLLPKLTNLWETITERLLPAIKPLVKAFGTTLVGAIGLAIDAANEIAGAVSWVIEEIKKGNPAVTILAVAFGGLAVAMALGTAFDALKVGFATLRLVTIPSAMASFTAFKTLLMTPMVMPAIAIGAVIASLATIIAKANETKDAIQGANDATSRYNSEMSKIQVEATKRFKSGQINEIQYNKLIKIGSQRMETFKMPNLWESFKTGAGLNRRASGGPVQANQPYLVGENPDGSINKTTELFVPSTSGYVLNSRNLTDAIRGSSGSSTVYNQTVNLTLAVEPRADFGYDDAVNMIKQINGVLKSQGLKLNQIGAVR